MKYCNHCGKELIDEAEYCTNCGCIVAKPSNNSASVQNDKPIKGHVLGFVFSFFLGLIGFLLALFLGDEECKKTATKTFIICTILSVIIIIIYIAVIASILSSYSYH